MRATSASSSRLQTRGSTLSSYGAASAPVSPPVAPPVAPRRSHRRKRAGGAGLPADVYKGSLEQLEGSPAALKLRLGDLVSADADVAEAATKVTARIVNLITALPRERVAVLLTADDARKNKELNNKAYLELIRRLAEAGIPARMAAGHRVTALEVFCLLQWQHARVVAATEGTGDGGMTKFALHTEIGGKGNHRPLDVRGFQLLVLAAVPPRGDMDAAKVFMFSAGPNVVTLPPAAGGGPRMVELDGASLFPRGETAVNAHLDQPGLLGLPGQCEGRHLDRSWPNVALFELGHPPAAMPWRARTLWPWRSFSRRPTTRHAISWRRRYAASGARWRRRCSSSGPSMRLRQRSSAGSAS